MLDGDVEVEMPPPDPCAVSPAARTQLLVANVREMVDGLALALGWIAAILFFTYLGFFIRIAVFPFVYERAVPLLCILVLFLVALYLRYFSGDVAAAAVSAPARARRAYAAVAAWRRGGGAYASEPSED